MNEEAMLLAAFRAMDRERKSLILVAMQGLAKDFPARLQSHLRLVLPNPLCSDGLGQRASD